MNCGEVQNGDIIERYLSSKLTGAERKAFESHYFECEECFAQLEAARAASQVLRETGPVAIRTRPRWMWSALAIAAALLLAVVVRQAMRPGASQVAERKTVPAAAAKTPPLLLAEIQPPPYSPMVLRGGDASAQAFQNAMTGYGRSDWRGTEDALGRVIEKFPHSAEAVYFRAICRLLSGDTAGGVEGLSRIIEQGNKTPFEEEARYYRAQAYLLEDKRAEARADLEQVIAMHGDHAAKAQGLEKKF